MKNEKVKNLSLEFSKTVFWSDYIEDCLDEFSKIFSQHLLILKNELLKMEIKNEE